MKAFHCESCKSLVFFENVKCLTCGHARGILCLSLANFAALGAGWQWGLGALLAHTQSDWSYSIFCKNGQEYEVCNWMVDANDPNAFCVSCRLNSLVPNLSVPGNTDPLAPARHRQTADYLCSPLCGWVFSVERGALGENRPALRFSFVSNQDGSPAPLTGHLNGLIVINIAEADEVERERRRVSLHEPYRTLLGHLRHEDGRITTGIN